MAKNKSRTMSRMRTIGILLVSVLLISVCAAEILAQAEPAGALFTLEAGSLNAGSEAPGPGAGNPEASSSGTGSVETGSVEPGTVETGSPDVEGMEPGQSDAYGVPDGAGQAGTGLDGAESGMEPGAEGGTQPGPEADAELGDGVGTEPGVEAGTEPGAEGNLEPGTEPARDSGGSFEAGLAAEQYGITVESTEYTGTLMETTGTATNGHLTALYSWISPNREIFVAFAINHPYTALAKDIINLSYGGVQLFPKPEQQLPQEGIDYYNETVLNVNGTELKNPNTQSYWLVVNYGVQTLMDPMILGLKYAQDGFTVSDLKVSISGFTVTYDPNGGAGVVTDPHGVYLEGDTVTVLDNAFTRAGYRFTGWNTQADGSGDAYSPGATFTMPANDVVLYAQWGARTLTVTATNQTKTYGDRFTFAGDEFTVDGLEDGDSVSRVTLNSNGAVESAAIGTYDIDISDAVGSGLEKYVINYVKGTLTVTKATGETLNITSYTGVYDGAPHSITVINVTDGDIVYYSLTNNGTDWTTTKPMFTDVTAETTVYVKVTNSNYNDRTGTGTVTINPKAVTITVDDASKVYGTADPDLTGTVEGLVAAGDLGTVSYIRTNKEENNVGEYPGALTATYTENSNYTVTVVPGNFTITPASTITVSAENVVKTYDGNSYGVSATSSVEGATIKYWNKVTDKYDLDASPAIANVSESVLTVNFQASHANYVTVTGQATVTINPKAVTITVHDASKVYATADPAFTGTVEGLVAAGDLGEVEYIRTNTAEGVGLYTKVLDAGYTPNSNYTVGVVPGDFTITAATGEALDITGYSDVYDGAPHSITVINVTDGDIVYYSLTNNGTDWTASKPMFTDVTAETTVYVKVENPNYNDRTGSGTVTIIPKAVTITVDNASKVYGTADPAFTGTVEGLVAAGDLGEVEYIRTGSDENVGTYPGVLTATYTDNTNYTVAVDKGNLTITAAATMTVSADDVVKTYDGNSYGVSATSNVTDAVIKYWNEEGEEYDLDASPAIANVSDSVLTVEFQASHANYVTVTGQATVTITPKAVTITVHDANKVYGTADPAFTGTVEGLVAEGDLGEVKYIRIGSDENVGTYPGVLTATYTDNTNYTVAVDKGNLTITAAATMTVSADDVVKTYDGNSYGVSATSNVADAVIKYWNVATSAYDLDASPAIANVSGSPLTVKFQASHPNYVTATGQATVTITARPIEITAASDTKTYDGTALSNSDYSLTGGSLPEADRLMSVTVTGSQTAVGSSANVASLAVIMRGGEIDVTGNYDITFIDGTLTVTERPYEPIDDPEIPLTPVLNKEDHFAYIHGYPDNTVRPEGNITREEVAAVFFRLLEANYRDSIRATVSRFPDVHVDRWSSKHIATLAVGAILEGYPDGTFRPGNYITRAELATIAARFDELSFLETNVFPDVEGHWAEKYINSAAKKGWVEGYPDGTFKPDQYITRAEFVTLVNRVLERRVRAENILPKAREFPDLKSSKWYYEAMQEAINSHLFEREPDGYETWLEITDPGLEW